MYINNHSYGAREPTHQEFTWSKSLAATLGALTRKSWTTAPKKASAKILFYGLVNSISLIKHNNYLKYFLTYHSIMMIGFVLYLHWEARLISYLAARDVIKPFADIQGLLRDSDFQIAVSLCLSKNAK